MASNSRVLVVLPLLSCLEYTGYVGMNIKSYDSENCPKRGEIGPKGRVIAV